MTFDSTSLPDMADLVVGILGGTGDQGKGLAYRFARAGQRVVVGSRSPERGEEAAAAIAAMPGVVGRVTGAANPAAAQASDVGIVAGPWGGDAETVASPRQQLA